jgi:hypothetical protein
MNGTLASLMSCEDVRQNRIMTADAGLTYQDLAAVLDDEGIPANRHVIGRNRELRDQVFVADKWSNLWAVYYTERGAKSGIRKHRTEDEACRDLLSRLRGNQLTSVGCSDDYRSLRRSSSARPQRPVLPRSAGGVHAGDA